MHDMASQSLRILRYPGVACSLQKCVSGTYSMSEVHQVQGPIVGTTFRKLHPKYSF